MLISSHHSIFPLLSCALRLSPSSVRHYSSSPYSNHPSRLLDPACLLLTLDEDPYYTGKDVTLEQSLFTYSSHNLLSVHIHIITKSVKLLPLVFRHCHLIITSLHTPRSYFPHCHHLRRRHISPRPSSSHLICTQVSISSGSLQHSELPT